MTTSARTMIPITLLLLGVCTLASSQQRKEITIDDKHYRSTMVFYQQQQIVAQYRLHSQIKEDTFLVEFKLVKEEPQIQENAPLTDKRTCRTPKQIAAAEKVVMPKPKPKMSARRQKRANERLKRNSKGRVTGQECDLQMVVGKTCRGALFMMESIEERMAGGDWIHMVHGIPQGFAGNVSEKIWNEQWSAKTVCFQKALDLEGDEYALISWWQAETCWVVEYWYRANHNSDDWGLKILYHFGGSPWLKHGDIQGVLQSPFHKAVKTGKLQMPIYETAEKSRCPWLPAYDEFGPHRMTKWNVAKGHHKEVYVTRSTK